MYLESLAEGAEDKDGDENEGLIITICVLNWMLTNHLINTRWPLGDSDGLTLSWSNAWRRNRRDGAVFWPTAEDL